MSRYLTLNLSGLALAFAWVMESTTEPEPIASVWMLLPLPVEFTSPATAILPLG